MKYLIMIMMNPEASAMWEKMGHDEQVAGYEAHNRVREAMDAAGELVAAEALQGQDVARRVRLRDGQVVATDGPFAEVKEHLAGYYLVDCASIEKAVEWASRMPEAEFVDIEVRPVLDLHAVVAAGPDT
ncbi:MAG: YciI family protein [Pseudonocardiaceae bacterium]|nr:MAG: YciI family protein [Pseudonocardiaceae bacterium]